jgi:hypothetical protein
MIWDGAYQFCFTLIADRPYAYLTRFHSFILWIPVWLLSHVTGNLTVLKMAYGLPFTLAPAASVLMSWWIVRRRAPHLVLWAIFGAAAGPLPGQIFIINDSIFQQHLFWPVFLGLLVPLTFPQMAALAVLVVFQFSHQIGLVLLLGGAGAAGLMAHFDRRHRTESLIKSATCVALAAVALWKIFAFPDSYAQREFTWASAKMAWLYGVAGWPLRGLICMWIAGGCLLLHARLDPVAWVRERAIARAIGLACVPLALVAWTHWAHDSQFWSDALNYRRWVVPLTVPFYLLAFLDRVLGMTHPPRISSLSRLVGYGVAGSFAVVLGIQSILWLRLTNHLIHDVEQYPSAVVPWSAIPWAIGTPLEHWGTSSYVFVREGRVPRRLLLDPNPVAARHQLDMLHQSPARVPLSPFTPARRWPGPTGWFDFRPLLAEAQRG